MKLLGLNTRVRSTCIPEMVRFRPQRLTVHVIVTLRLLACDEPQGGLLLVGRLWWVGLFGGAKLLESQGWSPLQRMGPAASWPELGRVGTVAGLWHPSQQPQTGQLHSSPPHTNPTHCKKPHIHSKLKIAFLTLTLIPVYPCPGSFTGYFQRGIKTAASR